MSPSYKHREDQPLHQIEARLRADATRESKCTPENLHRDIMAAVRAAPSHSRHIVSFRFPMRAAALAASILMVLGITLAERLEHGRAARAQAFAELSAYDYDAEARDLLAALPQRLAEPMERELAYLTDDIRRGAQFLLDQAN